MNIFSQTFLSCVIYSFLFFFSSPLLSQPHTQTLTYNLVNGLDVLLTPMSEKIGHTWSNGNVWDKNLIQQFDSLLASHNGHFVAIDLGAQTGCFSLLAKHFPNSNWYSFEPIQEAAETLKQNLILNGINNVSVYQMAAGNFTGKAVIKMPSMDAWGLATLGSDVLRFDPVMEREIDCIDLDSFVEAQQIKKVHFMKLDTEGYEFYILCGAKKMIMRDHPIIIMEYHETNMKQCGVSKKDIDSLLIELGYEWKMVTHEDILCIPIKTKRTVIAHFPFLFHESTFGSKLITD